MLHLESLSEFLTGLDTKLSEETDLSSKEKLDHNFRAIEVSDFLLLCNVAQAPLVEGVVLLVILAVKNHRQTGDTYSRPLIRNVTF